MKHFPGWPGSAVKLVKVDSLEFYYTDNAANELNRLNSLYGSVDAWQ